jgi:homoserine kinase type II
MSHSTPNASVQQKLQAISHYFSLGTIRSSRRAIGTNQNYFVTTTQGQFFFKIILTHSFEDVEKEAVYLQRLKVNAFPAAAYYIEAPDGSSVYHASDCIAVAMKKLKGKAPKVSERVCRTVGSNLARLHLVPADGLPEKGHWLDNTYLPEAIEVAKYTIGQGRLKELLRVYDRLRSFIPEAFPQSIIHGDLFTANCLFLDDQLCAFIDWEEVGTGASLLDVARSILGFCFVDQPSRWVEFAPHLYTSLLDGYLQIRLLTSDEQTHLEAAVKYACLTQPIWSLLQGEELKDLPLLLWILDTWALPKELAHMGKYPQKVINT